MNKSEIELIQQNRIKILKGFRIWAIIILIIFIAYIIFIDFGPFSIDFINNHTSIYNFLQSLKSIFTNIIPVIIIAIFIDPIIKYLTNIEDLIAENTKKEFLELKFSQLENFNSEIKKYFVNKDKYLEIFRIYYAYLDTDWKMLLEDAYELNICMFYTGISWRKKNEQIFLNYITNGGTINLFVPLVHSEISNRFTENTKIKKDIEDRIIQTQKYFTELSNKSKQKNITIRHLNTGFNYMYARIKRKNNNHLFMLSTYQNNIETSDSPVIIFNEENASENLKNFISNEIEFLNTGQEATDLEKEKFIIWDTPKNRVFISNSLSCNLGCKFCYVDSITQEKFEHNEEKLARQIYSDIRNDKRYITGKNGTAIMLGGFTDPFLPSNFDTSLKLIELFSATENYIHIATRFGFKNNLEKRFDSSKNVVINYSISTFTNKKLEVSNQESRFEEMKTLIELNYKVALYIRPIIQNETLKDIDKIIELAINAGIKIVTVGGLYVDGRIIDLLNKIDINLTSLNEIKKKFVLDDQKILTKLNIPDIQIIIEKLKINGLTVFQTAEDRIAYYKK